MLEKFLRWVNRNKPPDLCEERGHEFYPERYLKDRTKANGQEVKMFVIDKETARKYGPFAAQCLTCNKYFSVAWYQEVILPSTQLNPGESMTISLEREEG